MIVAIFSDIHGNLEALTVAINYIADLGVSKIYCCGDIVGYGPDPKQCLDFLMRYQFISVYGNHDKAITTESLAIYFNEDAVYVLNDQKLQLTQPDLRYLENLPMQINEKFFVITHSFLDKKRPFKYVLDNDTAIENLAFTRKPIIFIGHSHVPGVFSYNDRRMLYQDAKYGLDLDLQSASRYIINVGSIGQSRDNNPDLSFVLFDTVTLQLRFVRLSYPFTKTQEKMKLRGYPDFLYQRLSRGI
ncbi:metallophosphatase family protein [bacterium]|nr:metallophosphatase family protein [bacterium]